MIALVRKDKRRVILDPAFQVGDTMACQNGDEIRLLRMSRHGHMAEQATVVARMLRRAGWNVSIRDCDDLSPRPAQVVGRQPPEYDLTRDMLTRAALQAGSDLLESIGDAQHDGRAAQPEFRPPQPLPAPDEQSASATPNRRIVRGNREVCMICGHATYRGPAVASHVKNRGHDDWQVTPLEDVPALQRLIRARASEQAGASEASGEPFSASDQQANR